MNVIVTALLQIFLLVPLCLGDRVRIVQRRGAEVSLSCALPGLAGGWTLCAFSDEDGAECFLSPGEESHPCHDISGARIHVTEDGYCRILLTSLEDNNDGEWSCKVFDQDMEVSRKYFQIHIISEPSQAPLSVDTLLQPLQLVHHPAAHGLMAYADLDPP